MFGRNKHKPLYYMFAGQSKCNVRHNRRVLAWSCVLAVFVAAGMAVLLWALNT